MPHSKDARFEDFRDEYRVGPLEALNQFPKFIQLETISGCNAGCTMCSVASWSRGKAVMSDTLFTKIVEELASNAHWIEQVTVQLGGEPLLDKRLENRIASLKAAGMRSVTFTSNASTMTEARALSILGSGVDMVDFSIDGTTADTFEKIRINLSYEQVRDNVSRFIALRNEICSSVAVRVRMVIQEGNAREF